MLKIAGLTKLSTTDYPNKMVATIFLQGCQLNCLYCHNPCMIPTNVNGKIEWNQIIDFLKKRTGLLDGVVFSGGEITLYDLTEYINEVKNMGFEIGIHSQGVNYNNFKKILPLVDWVGFDVKALPNDIDKIVRAKNHSQNMLKSLDLLINSNTNFEIRTTYGYGIFDESYAKRISEWLKSKGVYKHILQYARTDGTRDEFVKKFKKKEYIL
jgi:anaerobic ribonucleoside-triphosphate reductase activating protein